MSREISTHYTECIDTSYVVVNQESQLPLKECRKWCKSCVLQHHQDLKCSRFKNSTDNQIYAEIEFKKSALKQTWPHVLWLASGAPCANNTVNHMEYNYQKDNFKLSDTTIIGTTISQFSPDPFSIMDMADHES